MLRVKGKGQSMISRTQTGTKSTTTRLPGIKWVSEQEGCGGGGTGRLFRNSRIRAEEKGIISLFWGLWIFFHDVMIFDFKFSSNRTAGSEDIIHFVAAHGPRSRHPTSSRIRLPCLIRYVCYIWTILLHATRRAMAAARLLPKQQRCAFTKNTHILFQTGITHCTSGQCPSNKTVLVTGHSRAPPFPETKETEGGQEGKQKNTKLQPRTGSVRPPFPLYPPPPP